MDDSTPNQPPRSPSRDDHGSGQSSFSTQGDKDEEANYPVIETSPANPAPTDFPNMTLKEVHDKFLNPNTKFADRETLRDFVSLISKNYHFGIGYACAAKIECAQGK